MANMKKEDVEGLGHVSSHSQTGQVLEDPNASYDAVFGEIKEGGPNYRNVRNIRGGPTPGY